VCALRDKSTSSNFTSMKDTLKAALCLKSSASVRPISPGDPSSPSILSYRGGGVISAGRVKRFKEIKVLTYMSSRSQFDHKRIPETCKEKGNVKKMKYVIKRKKKNEKE